MERKRIASIFVALCVALAFSVTPAAGLCLPGEFCDRDEDGFRRDHKRCDSCPGDLDCDDSWYDPTNTCVPGTMAVVDIEYVPWGGPNNDKHVQIRVRVRDDNGQLVEANVEIGVDVCDQGDVCEGECPSEVCDFDFCFMGTTSVDNNGLVLFNIPNAPFGCYTTTIIELIPIAPENLQWDGNCTVPPQEPHQFCKL